VRGGGGDGGFGCRMLWAGACSFIGDAVVYDAEDGTAMKTLQRCGRVGRCRKCDALDI